MTIEIKVTGQSKDIEKYFKSSYRNAKFIETITKKLSKKLDLEVDCRSYSEESHLCMSFNPRLIIDFVSMGRCELPKKKKRKHGK